jgi:hypothetical protein
MYCPKCGTLLPDDQKFCRACGLGLQEIAATVRRETSLTESRQPGPVEIPAQETTPDLMRRGIIVLLSSFLVGCLLPISAGLTSFYPWVDALAPVIAGVAGLVLFTGVIMIVYASTQKSAPSKSESTPIGDLPQADTTNRLEAPADQLTVAPSVTERTTEIFESKNRVKSK